MDEDHHGERSATRGVKAELVIAEGAPHIWQQFASFLPEARDSLERIAHHIWSHVQE